jgi:hypothetical protein
LFFGGEGETVVGTQGFTLGRQVVYGLSHTSSTNFNSFYCKLINNLYFPFYLLIIFFFMTFFSLEISYIKFVVLYSLALRSTW